MARFNTAGTSSQPVTRGKRSHNMEGGASFERGVRQEIATIVLNGMLSGRDSFYESEAGLKDRIEVLFNHAFSDPKHAEFAAKSIVYSRKMGNMRSLPVFLSAIMAETPLAQKGLVRPTIRAMVSRPDDMIELVALWDSRNPNGKHGQSSNVPNAVRRAIRDILESNRFERFQFKRYFGAGKVKMPDLVKISHPRAKVRGDETLFKQILDNDLPAIQTMETLRASGGKDTLTAMNDLLREKKLGYMAAVKNIKKFLTDGATEVDVSRWCDLITNEKAIRKSRMFPFRFVQAWNEISPLRVNYWNSAWSDTPYDSRDESLKIDSFLLRRVRTAIDTAFKISSEGMSIAGPGERVAVIVDSSGSMGNGSMNISPFHIATSMAAALFTKLDQDNVVYYTFDSECEDRTHTLSDSPINFISSQEFSGGATHFGAPLRKLIETNTKVDKIIMFTDMQLYQSGLGRGEGRYGYTHRPTCGFDRFMDEYQAINPDVKLMFWNLGAYAGGTPLSIDGNIMEVSGFSDNMLRVMGNLWEDPDYLVKEIEAVKL